MSLPKELREAVKVRAGFKCEYCGVSEADTGGELTIDHFQPKHLDGRDDFENLIYCCFKCNQFKHAFFGDAGAGHRLWNPRENSYFEHFLLGEHGHLVGLTKVGRLTIERLKLNRPPLVAFRLRQKFEEELREILQHYHNRLKVLEMLEQQRAELLQKQQLRMDEQQALLNWLFGFGDFSE